MDTILTRPIVSLSEAQAFVRVETGEEEALLAGLIRTASAICETFLNQVVICRPFEERLGGTGQWQSLAARPVRSIENVTLVAGSSPGAVLSSSDYQLDIDDTGAGWLLLPPRYRCTVSGVVGLAVHQNEVPEPIRQGVVRLVSHLYTVRDNRSDEPPASVTALWRPYRRLVFA